MIKSLQIVLIFIITVWGVYVAHSEELVVDSDMGNVIYSDLRGKNKPTDATLAQTDPSPESQELGPEGKATAKPESTARKIRYLVREGDTLEGIAKRFQLSVQEILDINGLVESANVIPGQFLVIPLRVKSPKVEVVREGEEGVVGEGLVSETDEAEPETQEDRKSTV